jgi:hexosaminidase
VSSTFQLALAGVPIESVRRPDAAIMNPTSKPFLLLVAMGFATSGLTTQGINPRPAVIPTLRHWTGGVGGLELSNESRIVVEQAHRTELEPIARVLCDDLRATSRLKLRIVFGSAPVSSDIALFIDGTLSTVGNEGYRLAVGDEVKASAKTPTGVFYATRTLLQMVCLAPDHRRLSKGETLDWPDYPERGFMLDVGRKFFDMKYLRQYVKFMSWFKLNDFQLHLNDDAEDDYSGFRLVSDRFPGLANKDGAYTHRQIDQLQVLAAQYHVNITPEIDAPAHARAFTKYRPDLGNPKLPKNHLDLHNPQTQVFVDDVWKEFIPWFRSPWVHIGADEYNGGPGSAPLYKAYINATAAFVRSQGKQVHMWGGLKTAGNSDGVDRNIVVNLWYPGYHDPIEAVKDGYNIINTQDDHLYIVPFAGYYYQFLDTRSLYSTWVPTTFDTEKLPEHDPHVLGGMFAVWNDKASFPYTFEDVHELVRPAMPTLGEILWSGHPASARSYTAFAEDANRLGDGPGVRISRPQVIRNPGDLAFGKAGSASERQTGDFGVQTLFDGRPPTRWIASGKKPQWASVDLGRTESVSRVILRWVPHAFATSYRISTSEDGTNWTSSFQTSSGNGGVETIRMPSVNTRYVRLDCLTPSKAGGAYSLFAFEVYP